MLMATGATVDRSGKHPAAASGNVADEIITQYLELHSKRDATGSSLQVVHYLKNQ